MSVTQQQDAGSAAAQGRPRPVLFLHIPRAAGSSFALTLRNVFGDNRVRQVDYVDERTQQVIDDLVRDELGGMSCLTGYLPMHLFDASLERFDPFTVLRDPVARVLSLYRFVKQGGLSERERLKLPEEFSLAEFLGSRQPELYGQINNGMVRMLCGDVTLTDTDFQEYWEIASAPNALASALANLRRMEFGLSEEIGRTLALMQVRWSIPYPLMEIRENVTKPDTAGSAHPMRWTWRCTSGRRCCSVSGSACCAGPRGTSGSIRWRSSTRRSIRKQERLHARPLRRR